MDRTTENNKDYNKAIESKTNYALTVTFKSLHCKSPRGQFYETIFEVTALMNRSTTFELMPEYRITNGSIHYHITFQIKDRVKWLKSTLPSLKRLGFVLVKPIDNLTKWNDYITKEQKIAEDILPEFKGHFPIKTMLKRVKERGLKKYYSLDDYIIQCLETENQSSQN